MSFTDYVTELTTDPAWRARHPHMHRRTVPLATLDGIELNPLTSPQQIEKAKWQAKIIAGDPIPPILVDIDDDYEGGFLLTAGSPIGARYGSAPILAAARAQTVATVRVVFRYDSQCVTERFWVANYPRERLTSC